jgi:hypothetical protein
VTAEHPLATLRHRHNAGPRHGARFEALVDGEAEDEREAAGEAKAAES